jgi:folate-binding protein YgfZ
LLDYTRIINVKPQDQQMSVPLQVSETAGQADPDLAAARSGSVLALLGHLGVLQLSGVDAESFLQGQLSCDVTAVGLRSSAYGAYCSSKGRMLANFLLWREEAGFHMALSRDIAASIQKHTSKFVLRAKVKVSDLSDAIVMAGAAGPKAAQALREVFPDFPEQPNEVSRRPGTGSIISLQDGRFLLALAPSSAAALRQRLANSLVPVGAGAWRWLDIRNGVPWVSAATQDQLVPQMANFELLGGVSFDKGCYTGQEVVARMQHLGKLKRRMFLANVPAEAKAGDPLYSEDLGDQASGMVVNAEASPDGGYDLLAAVQTASRESSTVHLKSLEGPALRFLPLPYALG